MPVRSSVQLCSGLHRRPAGGSNVLPVRFEGFGIDGTYESSNWLAVLESNGFGSPAPRLLLHHLQTENVSRTIVIILSP